MSVLNPTRLLREVALQQVPGWAVRCYCEDYPCCGHEAGDCDGSKYGSDESIKAAVYARGYDDDDQADSDYEQGGY